MKVIGGSDAYVAISVGSGDKALVYLGRYLYNHRDVVYAVLQEQKSDCIRLKCRLDSGTAPRSCILAVAAPCGL